MKKIWANWFKCDDRVIIILKRLTIRISQVLVPTNCGVGLATAVYRIILAVKIHERTVWWWQNKMQQSGTILWNMIQGLQYCKGLLSNDMPIFHTAYREMFEWKAKHSLWARLKRQLWLRSIRSVFWKWNGLLYPSHYRMIF